jgi:hypothetical protein
VDAINRLLARVQGAMTAQRRFVADAAHELRTPLAALSLQANACTKANCPTPPANACNAWNKGWQGRVRW